MALACPYERQSNSACDCASRGSTETDATAAEVKDDDDDDDNDDDDEAAAVVAAPCAKVEASRLDEGQLLTLGWLLFDMTQ